MSNYKKKIVINDSEYEIGVNITGQGAPTVSTEANPGMEYLDKLTGKMYYCTSDVDGVYIWKENVDEDVIRKAVVDKAPAIFESAQGVTIRAIDSYEAPLSGMSLFGRSAQNGTPTPSAPVPVEIPGVSGSITVTLEEEEGSTAQILTIPTPDGLPGIPVKDGGSYTDEDTQQWICDEVDLTRGIYIKRIFRLVLNGTEGFTLNRAGQFYYTHNCGFANYGSCLCNSFKGLETGAYYGTTDYSMSSSENRLWIYSTNFTDASSLKAYLAEKYAAGDPVVSYFILKEPEEIPLSDETLAAYTELCMFSPGTIVQNDAGVWMSVDYRADTGAFIRKHCGALESRIAALEAAILNI